MIGPMRRSVKCCSNGLTMLGNLAVVLVEAGDELIVGIIENLPVRSENLSPGELNLLGVLQASPFMLAHN